MIMLKSWGLPGTGAYNVVEDCPSEMVTIPLTVKSIFKLSSLKTDIKRLRKQRDSYKKKNDQLTDKVNSLL